MVCYFYLHLQIAYFLQYNHIISEFYLIITFLNLLVKFVSLKKDLKQHKSFKINLLLIDSILITLNINN